MKHISLNQPPLAVRNSRNRQFFIIGVAVFAFSRLAVKFNSQAARPQSVQVPVLKWQYGGCDKSWREAGWYASPFDKVVAPHRASDVVVGQNLEWMYQVARIVPQMTRSHK